jgi:enolase
MKIKQIKPRTIFNTSGEKTLEVDLIDANGEIASASVPSGKSKSSKEAKYTEEKDWDWAIKSIEIGLKDFSVENPAQFDEMLLKIDGTSDKSKLGANLILALAMAFRRLLSIKKRVPLWQILQEELKIENWKLKIDRSPAFLCNLIEGGSHAANNLSFQEYLIMINEGNAQKNLEVGIAVYKKLKNLCPVAGLGDENGLSLNFENSIKPFEVLQDIIKDLGFSQNVQLGLDAATTSFFTPTPTFQNATFMSESDFSSTKNPSNYSPSKELVWRYDFDGKKLNREEFLGVYDYLLNKFEISYLEDPLAEDDFEGFAKMTQKFPQVIIAGDDLTSTNPILIKEATEKRAISGVIIKPNQIGTVKETLEAIKLAKENGLKIIISHRSGETDDNFICHLAKAVSADAIKFGAPIKDRIFKYNEIIRIAE